MAELFRTPPPGSLTKEGVTPKVKEKSVFELLEEKEREVQLAEGLPFLYGWKWYKWARDFKESKNKVALLCAANQISKSSTQIRTCIDWATDQQVWPALWARRPVQFWYLYPSQKQVNAEFETKWKLFLPTGDYKDDEYYGYTVEKQRGDIVAIHFNSGVHVYFKTYSQNVDALQSGTCEAIFCDEELPLEYYEELMFRITASNGYFRMVFTATLGQDHWRRAMEPTEQEAADGKEFLPDAFKQTVSLYDAMFYEDGTPSHFTLSHIKMIEARCSTHNEILKRVFGKFIVMGGRKYEAFDIKRHMKPSHKLPKGWLIYVGADIGSGGKESHPSALCYVAVRPDYRAGRVFLGWRGDGIPTTSGDVVEKHIALKKEHKLQTTQQRYDWGARDFYEIASRMGEPFEKAEKSHEIGEDVINTLFKNDMLFIYDDPELAKLAGELATLRQDTLKRNAKDDFCDALRYAVASVPWDWSAITGTPAKLDEDPEKPMNDMERQINARRKDMLDADREEHERIESEFNEWNEAYGNDF